VSVIKGFFTDPTVCIGCKACEVACKEWNEVPEDGLVWSGHSYDHTQSLGHSSWRHVLFVEQNQALGAQVTPQTIARTSPVGTAGSPQAAQLRADASAPPATSARGTSSDDPFRWIFLSDVCKHCEHAGCLEACPTGSIVRTEVGSVLVQEDVCNGCGYCVVACPFGVVDRRPHDGRAFKCTFCYDRQQSNLAPACATVCPTQSIRFGPLDELHEYARQRVATLHARGYTDAELYTGAPLDDVIVAAAPVPAQAAETLEAVVHPPVSPQAVPASEATHAGAAKPTSGARGEDSPSSRNHSTQRARRSDRPPGSVGHLRAFFLTLGKPQAYNLPPNPKVPTVYLASSWTAAGLTSLAMLAAGILAARRKRASEP
jgi:formate dehydrogenase iron-sulfur subunit